ncbi:hypothetical protein HDE_06817 [Halotydeus destructor]|nr:hypothetical protein HDE_06817 [Halotydeus destructor]
MYLRATRYLCCYWLLAFVISASVSLKCEIFDNTLEESLEGFYDVNTTDTYHPFYHYFVYVEAVLVVMAFTWNVFALVSFLIMVSIVHSMKKTLIQRLVKKWSSLKLSDIYSATYQWKLLVISERKVNAIYSPILVSIIGWLFAFFTMIFVTYRKSMEQKHATLWTELFEMSYPALHFLTLLVLIAVNHRYNREINSLVKNLQVCQSFSLEDDPLDEPKETLVTDIVQNYERIIGVYSLCTINLGFVFSMVNAMIPLAIIILELWTDTKLS